MKTTTHFHQCVHDDADLLHLQLRIAQRADELAHVRHPKSRRISDRDCWLEAEREVLADPRRVTVDSPAFATGHVTRTCV